jgi:hypothetical protein
MRIPPPLAGKLPLQHLLDLPEEEQLARRRSAYQEVLSCGLYGHLSEAELQLLEQCLQADVTLRPTMQEVLETAYFRPSAGTGKRCLTPLLLGADKHSSQVTQTSNRQQLQGSATLPQAAAAAARGSVRCLAAPGYGAVHALQDPGRIVIMLCSDLLRIGVQYDMSRYEW